MSFKDCILSNVQKGLLDQSDADGLVKEHEFLLTKNSEATAATKLEQQILDRQIRQKANFLRHMKKREEFFGKMDSLKTTSEKVEFVSNNIQAARDKGAVTYETTLSVFNESTKTMEIDKIDAATFRDAVSHVIDGTSSKDSTVNALAQGMRNTFKYLKNEADTYGLIFGDLGERYFPRFYDKVGFRKISDADWVKETREFFNFRGASEKEIEDALLTFKKDVETDGLYSQTLPSNIEQAFDKTGEKNFALKRNQTRELNFKNSESYIAFTKKMGGSDNTLIDHFHKYMMSISNDLGTIKQLGSMPKSLIDEAELKIKSDYEAGKTKNSKAITIKNAASLRSMRSEFEVLMGSAFNGDREGHIYKAFVATQNWMRASQLGSATISALSDPSFGVIAQKMNGGSFLNPIKDYLSLFGNLVGHKSVAKEIADEVGYLVEGFNGMMIGDTRFTLGGEGKGVAKKLADLTFTLSGLDAWTKNGKTIAKVNANNTIATMIEKKISWDSLPDTLRSRLEKVGLSSEDWALASKHLPVKEMRGSRLYVQPNELRINKEIGYARGSDIADKIDTFVEQIKNLAINEGNIKTDALTSGAILGADGKASAVGKIGMAAVLQYKSFAISIMYNHLIPALKRASEVRGVNSLNKLDHLAMLTIGTTIAAALPLQLKEIIKGRRPKDMTDPKFWVASTLQGGGFGIMGDFLFQDTSRAGTSFAETLAGPYLGAVSDVYGVTTGSVRDALAPDADEKKAMKASERRAREAWRVLKRNTPLNNLWYTRLLTERLIFDNIERLADPQFDKRMNRLERKLTKEGEGKKPYWWGPGKAPDPGELLAGKTARR